MATLAPRHVEYCALCGLPPEFCEYNTDVPHLKPPPVAAAAVEAQLAGLSVLPNVSAPGEPVGVGGAAAVELADGEEEKKSSKSKKAPKKQARRMRDGETAAGLLWPRSSWRSASFRFSRTHQLAATLARDVCCLRKRPPLHLALTRLCSKYWWSERLATSASA